MRIFEYSCIAVYRAARIGTKENLLHIFNNDKLNELAINIIKLSYNYVKRQIAKDFMQFNDFYN